MVGFKNLFNSDKTEASEDGNDEKTVPSESEPQSGKITDQLVVKDQYCCMHVRTATLLIGWIGIVLCVLTVVAFTFVISGSVFMHNYEQFGLASSVPREEIWKTQSGMTMQNVQRGMYYKMTEIGYALSGCSPLYTIALLLCTVCLLIGVYTERRAWLRPFIICQAIGIHLYIGLSIVDLVTNGNYRNHDYTWLWCVVARVALLAIPIWSICVVVKFAKYVGRKEQLDEHNKTSPQIHC